MRLPDAPDRYTRDDEQAFRRRVEQELSRPVTSTASEERIAELVAGPAGQASFAFTQIPGTYRDLRVVIRGRGTKAASFAVVSVRFNGDATASYDAEADNANGATPAAIEVLGATQAPIAYVTAATGPAGAASGGDARIYDYRGGFQKAFLGTRYAKTSTAAGGLTTETVSGHWRNTAPITSLELFPDAGLFAANTVATLYGCY